MMKRTEKEKRTLFRIHLKKGRSLKVASNVVALGRFKSYVDLCLCIICDVLFGKIYIF